MTDTEAWAVIAAAFDKPVADRSVRELRLTGCGLCWAFTLVTGCSHKSTIDRFMPIFDGRLVPWSWRCSYNWTPDCDAGRATFACFMAALTPAERAELETP